MASFNRASPSRVDQTLVNDSTGVVVEPFACQGSKGLSYGRKKVNGLHRVAGRRLVQRAISDEMD